MFWPSRCSLGEQLPLFAQSFQCARIIGAAVFGGLVHEMTKWLSRRHVSPPDTSGATGSGAVLSTWRSRDVADEFPAASVTEMLKEWWPSARSPTGKFTRLVRSSHGFGCAKLHG